MHVLDISQPANLSRPLNILVADSVETMRKVSANQLRNMGAGQVHLARDGSEAWRLLRARLFDLVISEFDLPVANGLQLLKAVRADEQLKHLPFLLVTANGERRLVEAAINSGASGILLKPYSPAQLLLHAERAVRIKPGSKRAGEASAAPLPRATPVEGEEEGDERLSLLVVDDTPDNLLLLSQLFKEEYRVRLALSGQKALEACQSDRPPDLVLLDVMMPGMDGFELAKTLRERPDTEHIPIIFITAMSGADARLKGLDLGAVDFITKPVDPAQLKPKVRNFMRVLRQRRELQTQVDLALEAARERDAAAQAFREALQPPLADARLQVSWLEADKPLTPDRAERLRRLQEALLRAEQLLSGEAEVDGDKPAPGSGPEAFSPA